MNLHDIKQEEHYGAVVWCHETMDGLRRTNCLCLNCGTREAMQPCPQANIMYAMCKSFNIALAVTRCPDWTLPDKEDT